MMTKSGTICVSRVLLSRTAFSSIAVLILLAGCDARHSAPNSTAAIYNEVSEALVGKQITIQGTFSMQGKFGPYIQLNNQQMVYLVSNRTLDWTAKLSPVEGHRVAATGVLKFFHSPEPAPLDPTKAHPPNYLYFDADAAQLRFTSQ